MTEISAPRGTNSPTSAAPHMEPDILPGFLSETIALRPDDEGDVVATLVVRRAPVPRTRPSRPRSLGCGGRASTAFALFSGR
jgi:hypothetical protein